jgi:N-acetylneuraminic acid mutarotase
LRRLSAALLVVLVAGCGGGDGEEQRATVTDWQFAPPMANRRSYVAAGEIAGRIYVAGGMFGDAGTRLDRFQRFDPRRGIWTTLARLPEPVRAAAGAARGREFLVLGGTTESGGGRQVFVYDVAGRSWGEGPPLPRVLYNHSAVTVGDRIFVLGGYDTEGGELRTVYVLGGRRWRRTAPLPRPVHAFGAVVFRGEIWVIGGRRGEQQLREVWIYDPAADEWRRGPSLPKPMELLGATVVGDEIHAVWERTYQIYDAGTRRWRQGPPPLVPRHALSLFHVGGALYAVGGCTTKLRDTAVVETRPVS